jgi:hypothetical protein
MILSKEGKAGKGREVREGRERRWRFTAQKKHPDPSFELGPRPRTRVQNSDQAIRAKIQRFLIIFIYLFFLFTKKNLS